MDLLSRGRPVAYPHADEGRDLPDSVPGGHMQVNSYGTTGDRTAYKQGLLEYPQSTGLAPTRLQRYGQHQKKISRALSF
jgi:hypothetical protein